MHDTRRLPAGSRPRRRGRRAARRGAARRAPQRLLSAALCCLLGAAPAVASSGNGPSAAGAAPAAAESSSGAAAGGGGGEELTGDQIARRVEQRDDGESVAQTLVMKLIGKDGHERVRETRFFRKDEDGERRTVLFFTGPKSIEDTAFLTYDYPERGRDDDQWLYLPALRKVRRISASDRGHYFLGTDFTYDDIKNTGKVNVHDYEFRRAGEGEVEGHRCIRLEATPVSDEVADELGYGRGVLWVDPDIWMIRKAELWDVAGERLKTISVGDIRRVQGVWTAHRIEAESHQSGHRSVFLFRDVDYRDGVDDGLFTRRALRRGP